MRFTIEWTTPYQALWVDRHELEPEALRWVTTMACDCDAPKEVKVLAFERRTPKGTDYEPVYVEFARGTKEPTFDVVGEVGPDAGSIELRDPLPRQVKILALSDWSATTSVYARPTVVAIELDDHEGRKGIGIGYALEYVQQVERFKPSDSIPTMTHRLRTVIDQFGEHLEPLYFRSGA